MKDIIFELINDHTEGVDTYHHNGSFWLIFSDTKKWVIELTKEGTLWYNYYFFKNIFKYLSFDVVENQHYITEWVEDTIQNGVKNTLESGIGRFIFVEDTIQNGVKETRNTRQPMFHHVEDTIQNGVKDTQDGFSLHEYKAEEIIQNGVKYIKWSNLIPQATVEDTIQNGIKATTTNLFLSEDDNQISDVEDVIENGIKKTYSDKIPHEYDWSDQFTEDVEDAIQNGVKVIKAGAPDNIHRNRIIEDTIENGIKDVKPHFKILYNPMNFEPTFYEEKRLNLIDDVLTEGVKETWGYDKQPASRVERVINEGIKDTVSLKSDLEDTIDFIIKQNS